MLRVIREVKPRWVVGENVRGLVSWNGGLVFDEVQADLESAGYEVIPFILPAASVGAPHRRDRVWFVAYSESERIRGKKELENNKGQSGEWGGCNIDNINEVQFQNGPSSHSCGIGQQGQGRAEQCSDSTPYGDWKASWSYDVGRWPTQSPVCGRTNGISEWLVRHIKPNIYATISERYSNQEVQEVWNLFHSQEVREKIGRLYKIHEQGILLQVVQLCSPGYKYEKGLSVWSEKTSEKLLRKLREYGTFANTPHGRELEKQFTREFANSMPFLSHEIALVAMEVERAVISAKSKWRQATIKAYGNAVVPQVVYQIFKAIQQYEELNQI